MINVELKGRIGYNQTGPTKRMIKREVNGETIKVPFMYFSLFCEDKTKKKELDPNTQRLEYPKKSVQVILPDTKYGERIFNYLEPGRLMIVKGQFTSEQNTSNNITYSNEKCYMNHCEFLDSPHDKQTEYVLRNLLKAKIITETQFKEFLASSIDHYKKEHGEPRIFIDNTSVSANHIANENLDPDTFDATQ